jgi:integrase
MFYKYSPLIRPDGGRFRLDIPAKKSPTGVRIRERFDTEAFANGRAKELFVKKENLAIAVSNISPAQALDATRALALLADHPEVNLVDTAKLYREIAARDEASVLCEILFREFLSAKARRSPSTLTQYKWFTDSMEPLKSELVSRVSLQEIENILAGKPDGTFDAFRRYGRAVFNFAIARGWAKENPFLRLEKRAGPKHEVITLPAEKLKALLSTALDKHLEILPYYVFAFFCGIRADVSHGEITRLQWEDVDLAKQEVLVRAEVSKTKRRRRFVPIPDNAIEWLEAYRLKGGSMSGAVVPFGPAVMRKRYRQCRKDARLKSVAPCKPWVQSLARHSFCSAWLATHKDADKLLLISGHDSRQTMWDHYYRGMTVSEAAKYWEVKPSFSTPLKVIQFSGAA